MKRYAAAFLILISAFLLFSCGEKKNAEKASSGAAIAIGTEETSAATETRAQETTEAVPSSSAEETEIRAESRSESETEAPLVVTKHKEVGKHMVTCGGRTISVPTSFEGLELEGFEFSGEDVIVKARRQGSCRVRYKGEFNSIEIRVCNNQDYDMAVRDCTIMGIEIGSQEADPELTLFGIPMGATRQEIADVYGEPFSKTFDDEKGMSNMVYQFGTDIYSEQVVMIIFRDRRAVAASYEDFSQIVR